MCMRQNSLWALQKSCPSKENKIRLCSCILSLCFSVLPLEYTLVCSMGARRASDSFIALSWSCYSSLVSVEFLYLCNSRGSQNFKVRPSPRSRIHWLSWREGRKEGERERERDAIWITYRNSEESFSPGLLGHRRPYFAATTFLRSSKIEMCSNSNNFLNQ